MGRVVTISFCDQFIERLADDVARHYLPENKTGGPVSLRRLAIVFGGRRPALFLKKALARRVGGPFYPPVLFTIEEWIQYVIRKKEPFEQMAELDQCFLLYRLAREVTPGILNGREDFARFLPWAREILAFMDQLDLEQIDDEALGHIQANALIGYDVPRDINTLLRHIQTLRAAYHAALGRRRCYSRGMQYARAAQLVQEVPWDEFDQVIFANFFYFNRAEEAVVRWFYDQGLATLVFQGDERKWPVLKRLARRFGIRIREGDPLPEPTFRLHRHVGFDAHSQVGLVREIVQAHPPDEKTVIVLPDPGLIVVLMAELGGLLQDFNVSMGYPLRRSSVYTLCHLIFQAQVSRRESGYYTRDYLKVLRHPFVRRLSPRVDHPELMTVLSQAIEDILTGREKTALSGRLFIDPEELHDHQDLLRLTQERLKRSGETVSPDGIRQALAWTHAVFFHDWARVRTFAAFADSLRRTLSHLKTKGFVNEDPLNAHIIERMFGLQEELSRTAFRDETFEPADLFGIFEGQIEREMVAFEGTPLKGLQILGLFETRSLNFDRVIILDVNEGLLPRLSVYEPLIPREVMLSLNLDRLEMEEEIQRYQFMRLISAARDVHLVYQENRERERSRFVEELIWEAEKKGQRPVTGQDIRVGYRVRVRPQTKTVHKTPEMIAFLKRQTYSASSLNLYLRDPMAFYHTYVLGLRDPEDLLEEPGARQIGTFMHRLLHDLFKPFLGRRPVIDQAFRQRAERMFEAYFEETFGRNRASDAFLMRTVSLERLRRFLDQEEERTVDQILYLEQRFEDEIVLPCGKMRFSYVVDRVDRLANGHVIIIDYKTGRVDEMPKRPPKTKKDFSRQGLLEEMRSFQMPLYLRYFRRRFPNDFVNAALYNLRTLAMTPFLSGGEDSFEEYEGFFMEALDFILSEILDPEIPFEEVSVSN